MPKLLQLLKKKKKKKLVKNTKNQVKIAKSVQLLKASR